MVDVADRCGTMPMVGREDRALLRSNPSARSDARAWPGASPPTMRPLPSLSCLGPKAINLRSEGAARRTAKTPSPHLAVGHMCRFPARGPFGSLPPGGQPEHMGKPEGPLTGMPMPPRGHNATGSRASLTKGVGAVVGSAAPEPRAGRVGRGSPSGLALSGITPYASDRMLRDRCKLCSPVPTGLGPVGHSAPWQSLSAAQRPHSSHRGVAAAIFSRIFAVFP